MANSLPSYGVLSFDFLPGYRQRAQRLSTFCTDFSPEVATKGTAVVVQYQTATTASQWDTTNKYTSADETIGSATVTIQEPFYKEFYLSPNEVGSYSKEYLVPRMQAAVNSVLDEVEKKAYSMLQASTRVSLGTVSCSAMLFPAVQSGSAVLINSGSQGQVSFFVPSCAWTSLVNDARTSGFAVWDQVVQGGDAFQYGDATVRRAPKLDATKAVFATPDAVCLATRVPPVMDGVSRTLVSDEQTGLTIAIDLVPDPVGGVVRGRALVSLGYAVGRTSSACTYTLVS